MKRMPKLADGLTGRNEGKRASNPAPRAWVASCRAPALALRLFEGGIEGAGVGIEAITAGNGCIGGGTIFGLA